MSILWKNNATSALASDITAGSLSITVTTGHGDRFPEVVAPHYCMVTLVDTSGNREIVKVTARESASNTMTIERAQDGTTARAFEEGSVVELRITKNAMDEVSKASDINAQHYVCDASAADQGATANSNSLKSIVDALGATEEATIELPHTGTGDTTTYTVGTDLTIPDTVRLIPHKGVRISPSAGVTLTANCIIEANYQIFAGDGTVTVNSYPQDQAWTGTTRTPASTALAAVTPAADKLPYFTSGTAAGVCDLTADARTILSLSVAEQRILGRITGGTPAGLTAAEIRTLLGTAPFVVGSDADGDMWYRASSLLARLAKGAADTKLFMNAGATAPEWSKGIKVGTFTRGMADATGDVNYTGVGFKPALVILFARTAAACVSIGFSDGTTHYCFSVYGTTPVYDWASSACLYVLESGSKYQTLSLTMIADGFVGTWTLTGATASADINCGYIAFR